MDADIICIHQAEGGTVCGHGTGEHLSPAIDLGLPISGDVCRWGECPCREFIPGMKCPTCDGSGHYWGLWGESNGQRLPCPACVDSPVRGYVRAE